MGSSSDLSDAHEKALALIPILPSILSLTASAAIIRLVVCDSCKSPYKRILLALSISDIISSTAYAFQAFLVPRDTSHRVWAIGNERTCSMIGALSQFGLCALWYNVMLSIYYVSTIKFGVTEAWFRRKVEPYLHLLAIGYPLVTAIVGLVMGVFNEMDIGLGCWVAGYKCGPDPENPSCQSVTIGMIFAGYPFFLLFLVVTVNNVLIFAFVRRTTHRALRRVTFQDPNVGLDRVQAVAVQAFLYVGGFLMVYVWSMILRFLEGYTTLQNNELALFPLLVLQQIFMPMLGVFNLLVFVRPRYLQRRARIPEESRLLAFRRVINGVPTSRTTETSAQFALFSSRFRHHERRSSRLFPPPVQYILARLSRQSTGQDEAKQSRTSAEEEERQVDSITTEEAKNVDSAEGDVMQMDVSSEESGSEGKQSATAHSTTRRSEEDVVTTRHTLDTQGRLVRAGSSVEGVGEGAEATESTYDTHQETTEDAVETGGATEEVGGISEVMESTLDPVEEAGVVESRSDSQADVVEDS